MLGLGRAWVMSLGGILFCLKCVGTLDKFVGDNEESSLEVAVPASIKARDPFLQIQKRMGPMVNLEAIRQSALAITNSGEEEGPTLRKRAPSRKREGEGC